MASQQIIAHNKGAIVLYGQAMKARVQANSLRHRVSREAAERVAKKKENKDSGSAVNAVSVNPELWIDKFLLHPDGTPISPVSNQRGPDDGDTVKTDTLSSCLFATILTKLYGGPISTRLS